MNSTVGHICVDICTYAGAHKTVKTHLQIVVLDHQNILPPEHSAEAKIAYWGLMLFGISINCFGG
jgi:hypothetical protein